MENLALLHAKGYMFKERLKARAKHFLLDESGNEFNDGGSTNWGRNIAIGFAIAFVVYGLVSAFMPEIVSAWKGKILEMFN